VGNETYSGGEASVIGIGLALLLVAGFHFISAVRHGTTPQPHLEGSIGKGITCFVFSAAAIAGLVIILIGLVS
jgi:hypothetical protein